MERGEKRDEGKGCTGRGIPVGFPVESKYVLFPKEVRGRVLFFALADSFSTRCLLMPVPERNNFIHGSSSPLSLDFQPQGFAHCSASLDYV